MNKKTGGKTHLPVQQKIQKILELAVNCNFLSAEQEKEILPKLMAIPEKNPDKFTAHFFLKEKILPKDKIELLFAVKKHLDVLMQDKMFGKLGVANEFVTQEKVDQALNLQVEIFRKNKKSVKIGDILENIREISSAEKIAILLTQDRIRDELLAEALDTIAKTEMEKIDVNRRFGAIAIKKELITAKQLNKALKVQEKDLKEKGVKRYLGEILKELFSITDRDILNILKTQKAFETKRLNLKEKLARYHSEKKANEALDGFFEFRVSADKLTVWVKRRKESKEAVKVPELMNRLAQTGIKFGLCDQNQIAVYLEKNEAGGELQIAKGIPPTNHKEASVEFFFDAESVGDSEKPPVAKKGDTLARITPHQDGIPGKNVFDRPIPVPEIPELVLNPGEGVVRKGNEFIAKIDGTPGLYQKRTLFVMPVGQAVSIQEVEGDITEDTGESCVSSILKVKGNIAPGVTVACHGLQIEGDILGNVKATGDIVVKGNIGEIPENAEVLPDPIRISAQGSIDINRHIMNAKVFAAKGLNGPNSDILSSEVSSFQNIIVKNVLSYMNKPSILKIGRKNFFKIDGINAVVSQKKNELDTFLFKEEREQLTRELMEQIRIQNGYLENQNAVLSLKGILEDIELKEIKDISEKIKAVSERKKDLFIPANAKTNDFIGKIVERIKGLDEKDQNEYTRKLLENISGMYKAAVKATERMEKDHEARSKLMETELEKKKAEIATRKKQIEKLLSRRDLLLLNQEKAEAMGDPVIKVKNRVESETLIKGEKSELKIEGAIHGVSIKEEGKTSKDGRKIIIEGYFE